MRSASDAERWGTGHVTVPWSSRATSSPTIGAINAAKSDIGQENVRWTTLKTLGRMNCSKSSETNATAAARRVTGRGIANCQGTITESNEFWIQRLWNPILDEAVLGQSGCEVTGDFYFKGNSCPKIFNNLNVWDVYRPSMWEVALLHTEYMSLVLN